MNKSSDESGHTWPEDQWFLRSWRMSRGVTLRAVARETNLSTSSLDNWELGSTRPDIADLRRLDDYYGARGALVSLAQAGRIPDRVLPAKPELWMQFRHDGDAAWCWIRPDSDQPVHVRFWWGVFIGEFDVAVGGLVLTSPVAVKNPPVLLQASSPIWADYGKGILPKDLDLPFDDRSSIARVIALGLSDSIGNLIATELKRMSKSKVLGPMYSKVLSRSTSGPTLETDVNGDRSSAQKGIASIEPAYLPTKAEYQRLRISRCYDRKSVTDEVNLQYPSVPIGSTAIKRLEGGRNVACQFLVARLDVLYCCDGATTCEEVRVVYDGNEAHVFVPQFWYGPIWVQFSSTRSEAAPVLLHWSPWEREYLAEPNDLVTFRTGGPTDPLLVRLPRGWSIRAGMGCPPAAVDLNHGWDMAAGTRSLIVSQYGPVLWQFVRAYASDVPGLLRRLVMRNDDAPSNL